MRRLLALTFLATLLPAAIAHGRSAIVPTRSATIPAPWSAQGWPIVPKLMGERIAWVDGEPRTVNVWAADPATRRVRRIHRLYNDFADYFDMQPRLAASATRIALHAPMHPGGFLRAGAPGDLRPLDAGWADVDGDRLLLHGSARNQLWILDPIRGDRAEVVLPDPAPEPPPQPLHGSADLAGDLLAYHQNREGGVMEWRTGRVVSQWHTEDFGHVAGLQPDGTALWGEEAPLSPRPGPFSVTTAGGETRPLPLPAGVVPLLAGGRVAYHDRDRRAIVVADLTGREVASAALPPDATVSDLVPEWAAHPDRPRPVLADFDGRRAVWAYRPCAVAVVTIWDVDAGPPRQPRPRCRAARLAGRVSAVRAGAWRVPLRCDAPRLTGCATRLTLWTRGGRILARRRVDLPAGARRGVVLSGADGARRFAVVAQPALRAAPGERRTWRVRLP